MATPSYRTSPPWGGGFTSPPRPIWILLGIQLVSLILDSFAGSRFLVALLRLSPAVWEWGAVWQLATYPFVAAGGPSLFFLFTLLALAWMGGDVYRGLGRRHFWRLLAWAGLGAAAVACAAYLLLERAGAVALLGGGLVPPFSLMQGQRMLLTIFVAAFATAYRHATINLFFVLPIQARWFLAIEILVALLLFLQIKDLPGFLGICAAVGITYTYITSGGTSGGLRRRWGRLDRWLTEQKMRFKRRRRGMKVVDGGRGSGSVRQGPWVNRLAGYTSPHP